MASRHHHTFRMLRYFSITSLLCILVAALLLTWFYRKEAVNGMVSYGENTNLVLAQSLLNAVRPELSVYLETEELHHKVPLPQEVSAKIHRSMQNTSVVLVDILDDEGVVVYSTRDERMGRIYGEREGYKVAMSGNVQSLLQTDSISQLDGHRELIHSYIPIAKDNDGGAEGVFVVKSDVAPLMSEIESTQYQVFLTSVGIMLALYVVLLGIVQHAQRIISRQELQLRERSKALELLSSQLIAVQEQEKSRVAHELHEGIAQSLSSVKMRLERVDTLLKKNDSDDEAQLGPVVSLLREVISEVRSLALAIRPPSLDELGLLDTMSWYRREMVELYPQLELEQEQQIEESDIDGSLKVVIFRTLEQVLQALASYNVSTKMKISLALQATGAIRLTLADSLSLDKLSDEQRDIRSRHLRTIQEFIGITGGDVELVAANELGGTTLSVEWPG